MSSLLTNSASMTALMTLKGVNRGLDDVRAQVSTGMKVGSAKDNAATWAIATTMRGDVDGFNAISNNLATADSTIGVARAGAETVTDLLRQMKEKFAEAANGDKTDGDRTKIDNDVTELKNQITSTVNSAQFNGINLLQGGAGASFLSSLERDATGNVTAASIAVNAEDLTVVAAAASAAITSFDTGTGGNQIVADAGSETVVFGAAAPGGANEKYTVKLGEQTFNFVTDANDTLVDVASGFKSQIEAAFAGNVTVEIDDAAGTLGDLTITNNTGDDLDLSVIAQTNAAGGGGLAGLDALNATSQANATTALNAIDALINNSATAAADLGTQQMRVEKQAEFIDKLTSALQEGVGSLVDADMEEASARLQALNVQQQLGIQSLAQANQAPQNLLSLFR